MRWMLSRGQVTRRVCEGRGPFAGILITANAGAAIGRCGTYADTKGYVYGDCEETRFIQSAACDWVIRALNDDLPYDRFSSCKSQPTSSATRTSIAGRHGISDPGRRSSAWSTTLLMIA